MKKKTDMKKKIDVKKKIEIKPKTTVQASAQDNDFEYDQIRGAHGKKPKMAILNKTKLSRYEMDDLFMGEETSQGAQGEY